ncbi:MAG TPA: XdhC/CoxI family protein [Bacillales bacterium]|nr:XdhC/CoxI family protein [Bacillales bacterium]
MNENATVIEKMLKAEGSGQRTALATVVRVKGSAYRREGAKMLITEAGSTMGLISGGCLESDVAEVARGVIKNDKPLVKQYAMSEDQVWGLGLGCPGTVDILIESVPEGDPSFQAWVNSLRNEKAAVLATVLEDTADNRLRAGSRLFISEEGLVTGSLGSDHLNDQVVKLAEERLSRLHPKSETHSFSLADEEKVNIFVDVNVPPPQLMIFGAGHDAIPVARLARQIGMRTILVDARPAYATSERFPGTEIVLARPEELEKKVHPSPRTFAVIMNHHLERDQVCLRFALESSAAYVGVLGPRKRKRWLFEAFEEQGISFSEEQLSRLFNPIGLDIGAENAEEVAVSILSEIVAIRNGHEGGFLREKGSIHEPVRK